MSDALTSEALAPHLQGRFGTPYLYKPECESTQSLLLGSDLPEGAVAATDHQTGGRGRMGRSWVTPPGKALLVSVLLRPPGERHLPELSLVAALAAAETIDAATGLTAQVKWPNDVMLNRRKVVGILAELVEGTVVVGMGMNVNQTLGELPTDASTTPASLQSATGTTYERAPLLGSWLLRLERAYDAWRAAGLDSLYGELGARNFLHGRRVRVDGEPGTAWRILRDGRLEVETAAGETRALESGDVRFER